MKELLKHLDAITVDLKGFTSKFYETTSSSKFDRVLETLKLIYLSGSLQVGKTADVLYASDLLGAWLGALLVSIMLIPFLGILQTCFFVVSLKLISLILVIT